jgi:hypothetical protein
MTRSCRFTNKSKLSLGTSFVLVFFVLSAGLVQGCALTKCPVDENGNKIDCNIRGERRERLDRAIESRMPNALNTEPDLDQLDEEIKSLDGNGEGDLGDSAKLPKEAFEK